MQKESSRKHTVKQFAVPGGLRRHVLYVTLLIFIQLLIAATMRHQHAGLAITDFPLAYGKVWPATTPAAIADYNAHRPPGTIGNPITAFQVNLQMIHRLVAYAIFLGVAAAAMLARKKLGRDALTTFAFFWLGLLFVQILLTLGQAMLDRITKSAEAGLPNLAAMELHEREKGVTIVVCLRNYVETTALLGFAAQGKLLNKIRDRLILAAGHDRIYQIDNHSFAWRSKEEVPEVVESLEGLEALFAPGIQVDQLTVDITLHAGFCDDTGLLVQDALPKAVMAATNAINRGILWERYETDEEEMFWKLSILNEFEQALVHGDVWVAYQPKFNLHTNAIGGAEALIRWTHPERGFIRPDRFVRAIEDAGRIDRLTLYVLERAIADFAPLDLNIAVNLSMRMLGKNRLEKPLKHLLETYRMPAERLTLEITESASMADDQGIAELEALRGLGIQISIDDYGTGQSTLSYLKRLPASELKIDQSFVRQVLTSRSDAVLINSTIKLAHELDMHVVAEGVEDQQVLDALARMECDIIQGYHIGRPVAFAEFVNRFHPAAARNAA